ncbi:unnamed protein product [Parnassius apollo]|uniref:(apollo) hypothetical protein n=1 Tax=Parnassius apollo TaxID=110799 RepID=A0A8S3Y501_PARAO|nr:unnamed protein product [Parnassius apollo]
MDTFNTCENTRKEIERADCLVDTDRLSGSGDGADGAATACSELADTAPAARLRRSVSEASTTEQSDGGKLADSELSADL